MPISLILVNSQLLLACVSLGSSSSDAHLYETKKQIVTLDEKKARSEATKAKMDIMRRIEIELAKARGGVNPDLAVAGGNHEDDGMETS